MRTMCFVRDFCDFSALRHCGFVTTECFAFYRPMNGRIRTEYCDEIGTTSAADVYSSIQVLSHSR